jgi:endonuclease/exonuclease/phosphatase family metal-dependent hydrolase
MSRAFVARGLMMGLLVAMASPAAAQAPPLCSDGKCIQVGSYNIELFGLDRQPFDGIERPHRTDDQISRLAELITGFFDLEVVVFQEINTESDEWEKLKAALDARGFDFFEGTSSDRSQFVVLAWDADEVQLVEGTAQELDVRDSFNFGDDCQSEKLRKPVAGRFKAGQFDFWVFGVHLKSRVGEDNCTTRVRKEQCVDLVARINELVDETGEQDALIAGDFNERPGHESFQPLVDAGFKSQMQFLMTTSAKGSFVKNNRLHRSTDLIDQVLIRFNHTQEVVRNSGFVMPLPSEEKAKDYIIDLSDHVPVCVSFRIDEDLD